MRPRTSCRWCTDPIELLDNGFWAHVIGASHIFRCQSAEYYGPEAEPVDGTTA